MIDLSPLLTDPELGATAFQVERTTYRRNQDVSEIVSRDVIPATGCIHPGSPDQLAQLPEEDQSEPLIVVYTAFPLSMGTDEGITYAGPDRILWNGRNWRVVQVKPWTAFGYVSASAVLAES